MGQRGCRQEDGATVAGRNGAQVGNVVFHPAICNHDSFGLARGAAGRLDQVDTVGIVRKIEWLWRDRQAFIPVRPVCDRLGLAYESCAHSPPRLIYCSEKGFLPGPYENRTALDEVVQMMTGLAYMTGPTGRPLRIGSSANDIMAGLFGALSVLGALMQRQKDGEGHAIRVGLFENSLLLVAQHMVQYDLEGREAPPMPERDFSWPVYDIFDTDHGRQLFVGAVTEHQWEKLCRILGLQRLLDDPRLQSRMDQIDNRSWTLPIFAEAIAGRRYDDLVKAFEAAGLPFSPINRPAEMFDDPHVNRPGGLLTTTMPDGQRFRAPALPYEVDGNAPGPDNPDLPDVGRDTEAVLAGLGLTREQVAAAQGKKDAAA